VPEEQLKKIIVVAKKIAISYKKSLKVDEVNILHASGTNAGQSVNHFHIHVVPRKKADGLNLWYETKKEVVTNFDKILEKARLTK